LRLDSFTSVAVGLDKYINCEAFRSGYRRQDARFIQSVGEF